VFCFDRVLPDDTVSADIKLETETEDGLGEDVPSSLSPNMYHPRQALRNAINEWLPEFSKHKTAWGPIVKPQPAVAVIPLPIIPSINTCMTLTSTTTTTTGSMAQPVVNQNQLQALAEVCSTVTVSESLVSPVPGPVMNSLVSDTKVVCNDSIPNPIAPVPIPIAVSDCETKSITVLSGTHTKPEKEKNKIMNGDKPEEGQIDGKEVGKEEICMNTDTSTDLSNESSLSPSEPMDCNSTPNISPAHVVKAPVENSTEDVPMSETSTSSGSMQVETTDGANQMVVENQTDPDKKETELTFEDLSLLCDLFYLPFEHGGQGLQLLQEFNWLKSNAHVVIAANQKKDASRSEVSFRRRRCTVVAPVR
jgi:protein O-GlcNAcase/histone acetyltransferase